MVRRDVITQECQECGRVTYELAYLYLCVVVKRRQLNAAQQTCLSRIPVHTPTGFINLLYVYVYVQIQWINKRSVGP